MASVRSLCGFPVQGSGSSATDPHQAEGGHRSWAHGAAGKAWLRKCKNAGQAEGGVRNSTGSSEMRKTGRGVLQAPEWVFPWSTWKGPWCNMCSIAACGANTHSCCSLWKIPHWSIWVFPEGSVAC